MCRSGRGSSWHIEEDKLESMEDNDLQQFTVSTPHTNVLNIRILNMPSLLTGMLACQILSEQPDLVNYKITYFI